MLLILVSSRDQKSFSNLTIFTLIQDRNITKKGEKIMTIDYCSTMISSHHFWADLAGT